MPFDKAAIESTALWKWNGNDYYLLSYPPKSGGATETTNLVLAFKNNNDAAVTLAIEFMLQGIANIEQHLQEVQCKYLVSIPSHATGVPNRPCERVCHAVTNAFPWLQHMPHGLRRTKTVPKAAFAGLGQRPSYQDHRESIKFVGAAPAKKATFLMIDDVITQGSVSLACRDVLVQTANCRLAIGMYLGRTER